jgi:uncharacterized protein
MVVGLLGSVLPGLPGVALIFLSALVYAIITDFRTVGAAILVVIFTFAAIGFIAGALIAFLFLGSLFGLILGTIAGVFLGEYLKRTREDQQGPGSTVSDWHRASHAAGGVLVGYLASAGIQGLLALASAIVFVLALVYWHVGTRPVRRLSARRLAAASQHFS